MNKISSTIAGASILISLTGIFTKGLGFFREILYANFFGLKTEFDIYLVGAVLPLTINVIIYYLVQNYLIPSYKRSEKNESIEIENFIRNNLYVFNIIGIFLSLTLFIFSEAIIKAYLYNAKPDEIKTALIIFQLFLISIPVNCTISVLSASYHMRLKFNYPAYSQLFLNLSFIVLIILFSESLGIYIIPIGYIVSSLLQAYYLFKKSNVRIQGFHDNLLYDLRKSIRPSIILIVIIEGIGQLYFVVDRYFYNAVPAGGIAAINYAQTIFQLPIAILASSLSLVIFPRFTQYINVNLISEVVNKINNTIKINVILFVFITFLYLNFGEYFLKIFFERGKFSVTDTIVTYNVLFYLSFSLVFYSIYSVINKLIYSLGLIKNLLFLSLGGISIKIFLNILLVDTMDQDGLALSTTISYIYFFIGSIFLVYNRIAINFFPAFSNLITTCLESASRAFSRSSLTTEAGRSTTSPAAI